MAVLGINQQQTDTAFYQTHGCLPSHTASLSCGWHWIRLIDDKQTPKIVIL